MRVAAPPEFAHSRIFDINSCIFDIGNRLRNGKKNKTFSENSPDFIEKVVILHAKRNNKKICPNR